MMMAPLLLAAATPAVAPAKDCMDTAYTNVELAECTGAKVKAADERLNAAWKRLFADEGGSATPAGRTLLSEQRAWIAFREKACAEYFLPDAGREAEVIHGPLCIASIIDARTNDLKIRYFENHQDLPKN